MWLPSRLPWAVLALPLLLTSPVASSQEETGTPAEEQAKRAEALEVAARLSHLDLNDGNVRGGRQTNATLGLNWYVLSNVRFGVNAIWGHVAGDGDVWIGQTRLQIDF